LTWGRFDNGTFRLDIADKRYITNVVYQCNFGMMERLTITLL